MQLEGGGFQFKLQKNFASFRTGPHRSGLPWAATALCAVKPESHATIETSGPRNLGPATWLPSGVPQDIRAVCFQDCQ